MRRDKRRGLNVRPSASEQRKRSCSGFSVCGKSRKFASQWSRERLTDMRGHDEQQEGMFSYISTEQRVPQGHPLRRVRARVDVALK